MTKTLVGILAFLVATVVSEDLAAQQPSRLLTVDPETSRVVIEVGKAGLFSFAGHTHQVVAPAIVGRINLVESDPSRSTVRVEFDAAALMVTGEGEPEEDVPEVQQVMLSDQVLDVARYPSIEVESREVSVAERDDRSLNLVVAGELTLHGVTRPVILRANVILEARTVTVTGAVEIKQSDFGIEPVRAAAGMVRVKDELQVSFTIVARED